MPARIRPKLKYADNKIPVKWVREYLFEKYPNIFLEDFLIEAVINAYIDYIKHNLFENKIVKIISLGKFWVKEKILDSGKPQYYPKFTSSRHLILNLRQTRDSLTEAEKRSIAEKERFIAETWERKKARLKEVQEAKHPIMDVPLFLRKNIRRD
jgi:nucleoid DNA-binding protein